MYKADVETDVSAAQKKSALSSVQCCERFNVEAVSRSECHQPEVRSKPKKQLSDNLERPFPMEKWIPNQT